MFFLKKKQTTHVHTHKHTHARAHTQYSKFIKLSKKGPWKSIKMCQINDKRHKNLS